jgi:hypothetical protein
MLSCNCDFDTDDWWYDPPSDFTIYDKWVGKVCCSCHKSIIRFGDLCIAFNRFRNSWSDIEEKIWGDTVQLADWYLCESCGEIYLNLDSLGYCYLLGEDITDNLRDYWDITNFNPMQYISKVKKDAV